MDIISEVDSIFWTKGRLETFDKWPFQSSDNVCTPDQMAAAGFVAIGGSEEPDLVECFICSKQLNGWDPDDDPWKEHVKHAASCLYVQMNKRDETTWTVEDLFKMLKAFFVKQCRKDAEKLIIKINEEQRELAEQLPKAYKKWRSSLNS